MILASLLTVLYPIKFFGVTWKIIAMLLMPFISLLIIVNLWIKEPSEKEDKQKMGKPNKKMPWEDLGIEKEDSESNIIGAKNGFQPEKVADEEYDFPNQDPEMYTETEEDMFIEEKPKRNILPENAMRRQETVRLEPRVQQRQQQPQRVQQRMSVVTSEEDDDEEEVLRLMQKHVLLKKQLKQVRERLAEHGIVMK
jgi:hypothetical protein